MEQPHPSAFKKTVNPVSTREGGSALCRMSHQPQAVAVRESQQLSKVCAPHACPRCSSLGSAQDLPGGLHSFMRVCVFALFMSLLGVSKSISETAWLGQVTAGWGNGRSMQGQSVTMERDLQKDLG